MKDRATLRHPNSTPVGTIPVYALPFDTNNMLMYYNRDILNRYGISEPRDTWSWDEFAKVARGIANPPDQYSYSANNDWRHFVDLLGSAGGRVLSSDGKKVALNTPGALEALQFMVDVIHTYQIAPRPDQGAEFWRTGFAEGRLAFEVQGSYRLPQYSQLGVVNLGAAAQPQKRFRYSSAGGESVVIMKTQPARERAAWRFVDRITGTYANAKWSAVSGYLPVRRSSVAAPAYQEVLKNNALLRKFAEELNYGDRLQPVPGADQVFGILNRMASKAIARSVTPMQAIADAETELKAALKLP